MRVRPTMYGDLNKHLAAARHDDFVRAAAHHGRLRDRLAARWHAGPLDAKLARGVAPESDAALALRARVLVGGSARTALAGELRRIVRDARIEHRSPVTGIPTLRREVLAAAHELEAVAARLLAPVPVSAHGVAQVRMLLTDGSGPLYHHRAAEDLGAAAERALHDLDVRLGS